MRVCAYVRMCVCVRHSFTCFQSSICERVGGEVGMCARQRPQAVCSCSRCVILHVCVGVFTVWFCVCVCVCVMSVGERASLCVY